MNFLAGPLSDIVTKFGTGEGQNTLLESAEARNRRNTQFALGQLGAAAPSSQSSAFGLQGVDLAQRSTEAFNQFAEQQRLAFLQPALQSAQLLNAVSTTGGQAQRQALQGQLINPTLQLLGLGTSIATGTPAMQTIIPPSPISSAASGAGAGFLAGGPVGAGIGGGVGLLSALAGK